VVGYGRGTDFGNVYYGFTMLFVIGGLFGWIGGGLFGLALSDRADNPAPWHSLIVEMVAGGLLFYFFIIREFEWLMTPPRGEEWAACLGMAVAMTWFLFRNYHLAPVRVAFFAAMGAGFGFAFGNFLQVMGQSAGIEGLYLWNVMEYSFGFLGGAGMAYGAFTSKWDRSVSPPAERAEYRTRALPGEPCATLVFPAKNDRGIFGQVFAAGNMAGHFCLVFCLLALMALLAIQVHGPLPGMQKRFP